MPKKNQQVEEAAMELDEKAARKAAKKAAKLAAAQEEAAETPEEEAARLKAEKKAAKKAAKLAAAQEEAAETPEEEAARLKADRKAAKKAAKLAVAQEEDVEEKPKKKRKASEAVAEETAEAEKPKKQKIDAETNGNSSEELTVFVGGIPWSCTEEAFRKDFTECGEIEKLNLLLNDEGKPKGIAFVTYKDKAGVDAALKFDGTDYGGRTLKVNLAGQGGKGKDGKGKGKDKGKGDKGKGGGKGNNELTVCVRGLPFATTEEALKKDFEECGELERCKMLLNDEGTCKGIAFIEYKTMEGVEKAKAFNETDYGGRTIYVSLAGEGGGKGKDGKGKDGKDGKKGKGKDKGKGKGKKGKAPSEAKAKSSGTMVESTGEKTTFDDSDDDE